MFCLFNDDKVLEVLAMWLVYVLNLTFAKERQVAVTSALLLFFPLLFFLVGRCSAADVYKDLPLEAGNVFIIPTKT